MTQKQKRLLEAYCRYLPYDVSVLEPINFFDCPPTMPLKDRFKKTILTLENIADSLSEQRPLCLHPLSDLTKEIEINGERFVPINALGGGFCCEARRDKAFLALKRDILRQTLQIHHFEKLLEWHFDVFGLIPDFAIDINTLT